MEHERELVTEQRNETRRARCRGRRAAALLAASAFAPLASATILFQTGFEPGDPWLREEGMKSIVTSEAYTGSSSLQFRFQAYANEWTLCEAAFAPRMEVYVRYYQKNSANWIWSGIATKSSAIMAYDESRNPNKPWYIDTFHDYPTVTGKRGTMPMIHINNLGLGETTYQQNIGSEITFENDRWYCLEARVRANTPGNSDGLVEGWVDGVKKYSYQGLNLRASDPLLLNNFWMRGYWNNQSQDLDRTIYRWMDDVVVSSSYIGPIGGSPDTTAPTITITTPPGDLSTTDPTVALQGTAGDDVAVSSVAWANNAGGSASAIGTDSWTISAIALVTGPNTITVTARDAAGNTATDTVTVTRTLPPGPVDDPPDDPVSDPTLDPVIEGDDPETESVQLPTIRFLVRPNRVTASDIDTVEVLMDDPGRGAVVRFFTLDGRLVGTLLPGSSDGIARMSPDPAWSLRPGFYIVQYECRGEVHAEKLLIEP